VPLPPENVHPTATVSAAPDKSAQTYERELRNFFGSDPQFDLQLMGMGPEGHTASLFPDSAALNERQRWVLAVEVPATPPQRITTTLVVLNRGLNTIFLVIGSEKRQVIAALRNEPDSKPSQFPAGRVRPVGPVVWLLDQAAAG
jgi:6-phosphogluconolactonase